MTAADSLDRAGKSVVVAIFVALIVDCMDLQMLSLRLPSLMKELKISGVMADALGTYTMLGIARKRLHASRHTRCAEGRSGRRSVRNG